MRIPTGNFGNLTPQATTGRISQGNVGAVGAALSRVGASLGNVSDAIQAEQTKKDLAATQAALNDLYAKSTDRWENPETGALVTRQGFNSTGVGADMDKLDASDYEEARKKIPPSQLDYFDAQWKASQVKRFSTYNTFERAQTATAQQNQFETTVKTSVQQEANATEQGEKELRRSTSRSAGSGGA